MNKEEFIKELNKINIILTEEQLNQLEQYYKLVIEENKKYNLTAIINKEEFYLKHFYDSLTIIKSIELKNQTLIDIGSGAGFPGMVLKIVFPELNVNLLDSTNKKCQFLQMIVEKLNLKKINIINARAEEYAKITKEQYDIVTSRAVAPLKHLLEYSIPLLKINGIFISLKSNIESEIINLNNYYQKLYLHEEKIINFKLPKENSKRTIYTVKKYKSTPTKYPRMYSQIKKQEI